MAQVTLPYSLTAGTPENVNNLVANLNALRDGVNTIDTAQLASASVTEAKQAEGTFIPIGGIIPYASSTAPSNWLLCDGSEKAVSTYATLNSILGTTYGARTNGSGGAGSTHFRLPDLRGRVLAGLDNMGGSAASRLTSTVLSASNTMGATGGAQTHTMTTAEMPSHTHTQNAHNHSSGNHSFTVTNSAAAGYYYNGTNFDGSRQTTATTTANTTATNQNTGGGGAHNNTQPTLVVAYIIRAL